MRFMGKGFFLGVVFGLFVSSKAVSEDAYLIVGFDTEAQVESLTLRGLLSKTIIVPENMNHGSYLVYKLRVGSYRITSLETGVRTHKLNKDYDWGFDIKPGCINYIGHFLIDDFRWKKAVELVNRSSFFIEAFYGNESFDDNTSLCYSGPGKDSFIDFFQ